MKKSFFLIVSPFLLILFLSCSKETDRSMNIPSFTPEMKEITDRHTGVPIRQLTNYKGHSHHFYFTNPAWYAKDKKLLFSSDRNNRTNLFGIDLQDYSIEQLTDLEPVPLPREVEFFSEENLPDNKYARKGSMDGHGALRAPV